MIRDSHSCRRWLSSTFAGLTLVTVVLGATSPAQAWDGRRTGFLLGVGAGAGALKTDIYDRPGVAGLVEGTVGFGISNQFAVLLNAPLVWSEYDSTPETHGRFALQYWLRPQAPSMYFNLGIRNVTSNDLNLYAGWGHEFRKHFNVEIGVTATFNNQNDVALLGKLLVLGY